MLSKLVADREASDREVLAAMETHGKAAAPRLMDLLRPYLKEGEGAPDLGLFMTLLARMLADRSGAMSTADRAHHRELGDAGPARDARDLAAARLSALITRARAAATAQFGREFGGELGVSGETPRQPDHLRSFAAHFIRAVEQADFRAPADRDDDDTITTVDKDRLLARLRAGLASLDDALNQVAGETREAEATLVAKDRAIAARDEAFRVAANLTSALLESVGEYKLAGRVRPSVSRPSVVAAPDSPAPDTPAT